MAVVLERDEIEGRNLAVGRVAGDEVHLPVRERAVGDPEVHGRGRRAERKTIHTGEPGKPVGALQELVTEPGPPGARHPGDVRDAPQAVSAGPPAPNPAGARLGPPERP